MSLAAESLQLLDGLLEASGLFEPSAVDIDGLVGADDVGPGVSVGDRPSFLAGQTFGRFHRAFLGEGRLVNIRRLGREVEAESGHQLRFVVRTGGEDE